jgi:hypothetical protein
VVADLFPPEATVIDEDDDGGDAENDSDDGR